MFRHPMSKTLLALACEDLVVWPVNFFTALRRSLLERGTSRFFPGAYSTFRIEKRENRLLSASMTPFFFVNRLSLWRVSPIMTVSLVPGEGWSVRRGRKWYAKGEKQANFRKIKKFAQAPAWGAYFNSLVNLGFFVTDQQLP